MRDRVYTTPQSHIVDFAFTEEVAAVFPDMIRRSVIGYETVIPVAGLLAARHLLDVQGKQGFAVDLGCSLGATSQAILAQNPSDQIRVLGIDNSRPMIDGAIAANEDPRGEFILGDITDPAMLARCEGADVIILNFVLQFLEPEARLGLLRTLSEILAPQNGLLILSEKVQNADVDLQTFYNDSHLAWKKANGYSDLEVSQKRTALENVMRIDTEAEHEQRLIDAGFGSVTQWYRCLNWASFLAHT